MIVDNNENIITKQPKNPVKLPNEQHKKALSLDYLGCWLIILISFNDFRDFSLFLRCF
jgi:hypothetical protein